MKSLNIMPKKGQKNNNKIKCILYKQLKKHQLINNHHVSGKNSDDWVNLTLSNFHGTAQQLQLPGGVESVCCGMGQ